MDENFNDLPKSTTINCICDYCGIHFLRSKRLVIRSKNITEKDSCGQTSCRTAKRQDSFNKLFNGNPMNNEKIRNKHKNTCLEIYGVENVFTSEEIKKKIAETHVKNLGVNHPSKSETIKNKKKQTWIDHYGVDNPTKSPIVQKKTRKTCEELYGQDCVFKNEIIKDKIKKTNIERYGVENPLQSAEIREKCKKTLIENIGYENPFSSPSIRQSIMDNNVLKYGSPYPPHPHKTQDEIQEWLNSFGFSFVETWDVLGNKQIDMYDQSLKLAIEYCGLYWHTEFSPTPRDKNYHYEKYLKCYEKGIRLITIFSDEWLLRRKQCENFLKSILGIYTQKIYARKCQIKQNDNCRDFVENNHIQGITNQTIINFSLHYDEKIVGCLSLGRHPRQSDTLILDRLCFPDGVLVIGGASKLFNECKKWLLVNNYNSLISFSDNRWTQGKIYEILGFHVDEELKPDYSYVCLRNPTKRLSKQSQSKKKTNCPIHLTEHEWSIERGMAKIWDCGKKRWKYNGKT